nr:4Fe-4S binding protein [Desulfospira joergensenii]
MFESVVSYYIDPEKCKACMICARNCPVDAIEGGKGMVHVIDQEACIKCETCYNVCPDKFGAVTKIVSEPVPDPMPVAARAISR